MPESRPVFLDAGVLIGALLRGDLRHSEARPLLQRFAFFTQIGTRLT